MAEPGVKPEAGEPSTSPALPEVQPKPDEQAILSLIKEVKQELQDDPREINRTRFPRALYKTPSAPRADTSRGPGSSEANTSHRSRGSSAQIQSSPLSSSRDRLMEVQLRLRRERDARTGPRGPTGAGAGQLTASRGGRGTGRPDLYPAPGWQTSANSNSYRPYRNGQSGPYSSVVERLSRECQMRHFNLEWQFQTFRSGKFTCHVKLRDYIVMGNGEYKCRQTAKAAVARRALAVVQAWPLDSYWPEPTYMPARSQAHMEVFREGRSGPIVKQEGPSLMSAPGHGALTVMAPERMRSEQQAAVLGQMGRAMGIPAPESSRTNLEATQAFLEGVAVGTRLAGAGVSGFSMRDRSRSPANFGRPSPSAYRARSSTRENGRLNSYPQNRRPAMSPSRLPAREHGRLTPPSVHDRWVHDRYRDDSRPTRN
ncbi:predicted protein [Chaetomium globosum CBS 148.51]|uniref:Uncharacterized protein n=1 Tax=Chaetomium globosum (strain ATCC 6205 / CBS 148.51 / DSM 1962 / NBRC 6347 / NRRL 1970) TaxID=306901 RepID=Q2HCT7_CHAGB|nr:uncharacterized protein CHGG_01967 [Chaetomium globosum CBS 148.51]EAQ93732.1 predicted protein [Chaetomium globosum CBS 148.51]